MEFLLCIIALLAIVGSKFQKKSTAPAQHDIESLVDPLNALNWYNPASPYYKGYKGDGHIND